MKDQIRRGSVWFALLAIAAASAGFAQLEQGVQLFESERYDDAQAFFESVAQQDPSNAEAAFHLGRVFMAKENAKEAATWFKKAVELDEANSNYHYWLGAAYGNQAQRANVLKKASLAKKTKAAFLRAVELDPDNLDARDGLMQYYLQAPGIMGGSKEKAQAQAREILHRDAFRGHLAMGQVYNAEEKYEDAATAYRAAINVQPDRVDPYYQLGYAYLNMEQYEQAIQAFEEGLTAHPDELKLYYQIGRVGALSGHHLEHAEAALKTYVQKGTDEGNAWLAWAHFRLGNVYEHQGDKEAAGAAYQETLRLDPKHKDARKALKKLN